MQQIRLSSQSPLNTQAETFTRRVQRAAWIAALYLALFSTPLRAGIENDSQPGLGEFPLLSGYSPSVQLNAAEIQLGLQRLLTNKTVMYMAAHPDDENQAVLAWCRSELGVRTAYLSLTRGDGGQNLIGTEKGDALGVLRTEELLAARGVDGAEQFFTRALDFGYSKTVDETLNTWSRDAILEDVVWVIRNVQPDIIITRFPGDGSGGHGHHTASAQLAVEGAKAAADPTQFTDQLKHVPVWQVRSVLWNSWFPDDPDDSESPQSVARFETGLYNNLLGESYLEIAARARSQHRCQGFGASPQRGRRTEFFRLLSGAPPTDENRLFSDAELTADPTLESTIHLRRALGSYNPEQPQYIVGDLLQALDALRGEEVTALNTFKQREVQKLIAAASGFWLEARSFQEYVTPGDSLRLQFRLLSRMRSEEPPGGYAEVNTLVNLHIGGETIELQRGDLMQESEITFDKTVLLPASTPLTQPYWLQNEKNGAMYDVEDPLTIGRAWNAPQVYVSCRLEYGKTTLNFGLPLRYRWTDPAFGERFKPLEITPPVTLNFARSTLLFDNPDARTISLRIKSYSDMAKGRVKLTGLGGWKSNPAFHNFELKAGIEQHLEFTLSQSDEQPDTSFVLDVGALATLDGNGRQYDQSEELIDYEHIPRRTIYKKAQLKVIRSDMRTTAHKIGYIMGSGDDVPDALEQMGSEVVLLDDAMLTSVDLQQFDAIVAGIRAYNTREHLRQVQDKLMDYVFKGGVFVVQYTVSRGTVVEEIGPYPFNLSRGRVTDEKAEMKVLDFNSSLLNTPNLIEARDYDNWVQERGLYFAADMAPEYATPFASHDPGEQDLRGSLIAADYGQGVFVYTGISFFRQLPAGVPGAFKLFANLVSGGRK